uniref:RabBD domain-containing protein n=1 Tax=Paramormyrops kingsleyae TaxID=1676925 RepID=A0A3B3TC89_9TELE
MGRKLDLSGLTHKEAEHVLQVVKRDMMLRKKEEKRLRELRRELAEEGSRCLLLSRQEQFNQRCCMRCCSPFTFLLNRKRLCDDCGYNVCRSCGSYSAEERAWICTACHKARSPFPGLSNKASSYIHNAFLVMNVILISGGMSSCHWE